MKPQIKLEPNAAGLLPGDEVIDSDLDDSDDELRDEGEEDGEGEIDIVFCVYDKVGDSCRTLGWPMLTSRSKGSRTSGRRCSKMV